MGSGDSSNECYSWAADGQCKLNPGHMLTTCKYSCWEWYEYRKSKYPDAPIDKEFGCHGWANAGECHKNKDFMEKSCPESCKGKYDPPEEVTPPKSTKSKKKKKRKKTE